VLVFVHGYAASGALFYRTYQHLKEHFCVLMIDMIGMGGSSRPENFDKCTKPQQCIDYFLNYMEKWRIAMGNLTGFYIAGHSFGGFIVGNYALKF
jgi:pimeloyl-ACP methyl ester carboxylesterase